MKTRKILKKRATRAAKSHGKPGRDNRWRDRGRAERLLEEALDAHIRRIGIDGCLRVLRRAESLGVFVEDVPYGENCVGNVFDEAWAVLRFASRDGDGTIRRALLG